MPASHFHMAHVCALEERSSQSCSTLICGTNNNDRLGWLELRTVLAKLHFKYDIELLDPSLDWHTKVEMHLLWKKPALNVRIKEASRGTNNSSKE